MSKQDNSGPAFPVDQCNPYHEGSPGLSKRELLAGMCMAGMLAREQVGNPDTAIANNATAYADALLAALEKNDDNEAV